MSGSLEIGALRHRVTIEQAVPSDDGAGGSTTAWIAIATVWAHVAPVKALQAERFGRLDGVVTHRVTMRHRDDVVGGMRLIHGSRILRLLVVHDPDERDRWLECLAEEVGR